MARSVCEGKIKGDVVKYNGLEMTVKQNDPMRGEFMFENELVIGYEYVEPHVPQELDELDGSAHSYLMTNSLVQCTSSTSTPVSAAAGKAKRKNSSSAGANANKKTKAAVVCKRIPPQSMIEVHVDEQSTYTSTEVGCSSTCTTYDTTPTPYPSTCSTFINDNTKTILDRLDTIENKLNAIMTKQSDIDTKLDDLISQSQQNLSLSFLLGAGGDRSSHADGQVPVPTTTVAASTTCTVQSVATPDNVHVATVATSIVGTDTTGTGMSVARENVATGAYDPLSSISGSISGSVPTDSSVTGSSVTGIIPVAVGNTATSSFTSNIPATSVTSNIPVGVGNTATGTLFSGNIPVAAGTAATGTSFTGNMHMPAATSNVAPGTYYDGQIHVGSNNAPSTTSYIYPYNHDLQTTVSNRKWYYIKADCKSRQNFAWHVSKEIFAKDELVGHNCSGRSNGKHDKPALNAEKLNIVREIVFYYWPRNPIEDGNKNESKLWNVCKEAINSALRSKKEYQVHVDS